MGRAADADHLYLSFLACPPSSCAGDTFDLVASDDRGRTWTVRSGGVAIHDWVVLGPRTLVGSSRPGGTPFSTLTVSVDAGRTWSVQVFTNVAGCSPGRCVAPELSTVDGWTAYAVIIDFQAINGWSIAAWTAAAGNRSAL